MTAGLIPAVMGILRYRRLSYWRWVVAIFIWQSAAMFLFAAFGSLEAPERDGLIIRAVRQATNDGHMVALVGLAFLIVFWGGIIYFARRLYVDAKSPALGLACGHAGLESSQGAGVRGADRCDGLAALFQQQRHECAVAARRAL